MTETVLDRALEAYEAWFDDKTSTIRANPFQERAMLKALVAALKVRWEELSVDGSYRAWLGRWNVGGIARSKQEFVGWEHGRSLGSFSTISGAKTGVQLAIFKAILGVSE